VFDEIEYPHSYRCG